MAHFKYAALKNIIFELAMKDFLNSVSMSKTPEILNLLDFSFTDSVDFKETNILYVN